MQLCDSLFASPVTFNRLRKTIVPKLILTFLIIVIYENLVYSLFHILKEEVCQSRFRSTCTKKRYIHVLDKMQLKIMERHSCLMLRNKYMICSNLLM